MITSPVRAWPLRGIVAAGWPSPAEEELLDTLSFDEWLNPNPEACFLINVSSDAMVDAGIHPDDTVVVERGRKVRDGDIVVAAVDEQWVLRYYQDNHGQPHLLPANGRYEALVPHEKLQVVGVVVACIRKYY